MKTLVIAAHPWLRDDSRPINLDILIYKLVKAYLHATPFKRAALKVHPPLLTRAHACVCLPLRILYCILILIVKTLFTM